MNLKSLYLMTSDKERILEFLIKRKLIPLRRKSRCGAFQEITKGGKTDMNYRYRGQRPCRKETTLLKSPLL